LEHNSKAVHHGVALSLCGMMRVAIKEGIVHRDIKPENIIVRKLAVQGPELPPVPPPHRSE
jgi:serine/threonine protein kinase